jgi:hypothetical protein
MKKLNKISLAIGVALAATSIGGYAGTFEVNSSETVGVEAATAGNLTANIGSDKQAAIELVPSGPANLNDKLVITLNEGTFADSKYVLAASVNGETNDTITSTLLTQGVGTNTLEFRIVDTFSTGVQWVLSGSDVASQPVTINIPAVSAGDTVTIDAEHQTSNNVALEFFDAAVLFTAANQFSAHIETKADETIDVESDRKTFLADAKVDTIVLDFVNNAEVDSDNRVDLTAGTDKVDIVLSGDMSDIASISLTAGGSNQGDFTIDVDAGTATFAAEASDVFSATSTTLTATVTGSQALATRSFTVQADLDFDAETDKNLVAAGTSAGEWTINGLQAKVSQLGLNSTGFLTWLKVVNEGTTDAEITADIIWTLGDGTEGSESAASLGTVDAGGIFTISEAAILTAMGNPDQRADVSMTVTVAGQQNSVHIIAEKKASDGRTMIPVYYNNTSTGSASDRKWFQ